MFAAVVGHSFGRATPSLRNAPPRQLMEIVRGETVYRNRNAVQTNPAISAVNTLSVRRPCSCRKRIEEMFGWLNTMGGLRKTRHRGTRRVGWMFTFVAAAYNLVRIPRLLSDQT